MLKVRAALAVATLLTLSLLPATAAHSAPALPDGPAVTPMTRAITTPTFLETREYRRFTEFADAVRRDRYIGLCYGTPGVGKTLSARHDSHSDATEDYVVRMQRPALDRFTYRPPAELATVRCVCWTAPVLVTASHINRAEDPA